jgi:hypothetical protein
VTDSSSPRGARLPRLAGEFAVIVVGVLVALVAESWWSERDERRYEAELRADMLEEFRTNLEIVAADLEENAVVADLLNQVAEMGDGELLTRPDSAFAFFASGDLSWAGFDPMMGSAQALVQSGNLGAIADRALRLRLSNWSGLLDEKTRFTLQAVTFQSQIVLPSAARFGADEVWTPDERRELRSLLRTLRDRQRLVIENQLRLQASARALVDYLSR